MPISQSITNWLPHLPTRELSCRTPNWQAFDHPNKVPLFATKIATSTRDLLLDNRAIDVFTAETAALEIFVAVVPSTAQCQIKSTRRVACFSCALPQLGYLKTHFFFVLKNSKQRDTWFKY